MAGTITGTVRSAATSQPLGSIVVDAYDTAGTLRGSGTTDQSGTYILALPAGSYRVLAWDRLGVWATMFGGNAESFDTTPVTVIGENDVTRRDFALVGGGTVAGSVVRANGSPAAGAVVEVYNLSGTRRAFASTNSQGNYSIVLPPGQYKLIAYDPNGEYSFSFHPGVRTFAEASPVAVATAALSAVDFRLEIAARVSGTVVDLASGLPLGAISVYAYTPSGVQVTTTTTGANGMFSLAVPAGDYRIVAADPSRRYATGFYGLGRSFETSPVIALKSGTSQGDVHLGLMRAATIAGRVTDSSGVPLSNVTAAAYNLDGTLHASAVTAADGSYELLVAPGTLKLLVFDANLVYATAFFGGARDFTSANALALAAGQALRELDFRLSPGGRITGTVRANGSPRAGITVAAYDAAGFLTGSATTRAEGTFAFVLPAGDYRIIAFDPAKVYVTAYDGGAVTFETTVPRAVSAGSSGTVDFDLRRGILVHGQVTNAAGQPVEVNVYAVDAAGNRVAGALSTGGAFAIVVAPGGYKFMAVDPQGRYRVTYFENASTLGAARWVNVTEGMPIPPIVFQLETSMRRRAVRS